MYLHFRVVRGHAKAHKTKRYWKLIKNIHLYRTSFLKERILSQNYILSILSKKCLIFSWTRIVISVQGTEKDYKTPRGRLGFRKWIILSNLLELVSGVESCRATPDHAHPQRVTESPGRSCPTPAPSRLCQSEAHTSRCPAGETGTRRPSIHYLYYLRWK